MKRLLLATLTACFIAGCGQSTPAEDTPPAEQDSTGLAAMETAPKPALAVERVPPEAEVDADPQADAQLQATSAGADCAGIKAQAPPAGRPVDDIIGIRIGHSLEDVRAILACSSAGYSVIEKDARTPNNLNGRISELPEKVVTADNGLDKIEIFLLGSEGQENVYGIVRNLEFAEGNEMLVSGLLEQLKTKYGPFIEISDAHRQYSAMMTYSGDGQVLGKTNRAFASCQSAASAGPAAKMGTGQTCGLTIYVSIDKSLNNTTLVRKWRLVVIDEISAIQAASSSSSEAEEPKATSTSDEVPIDL